mmetsp:Transcript_49389/g.118815  ORF Transcript_49389/g.118815 Transcript_49389/m.118815 type:complete len:1314 (-) Transcript_49389:71-4012(-)
MCPRTPAEMEQQVEEKAALLEVVGGAAKGGIIVRAGRETSSEELSERLSTGSVVRALESDGGRVYYEMVRGFGPLRGWVSTNIQDKVLLAACDEAALESAEEVKNQKEEEAKAAMALQLYGDLMASEQVEEMEGFKAKQAFPWSLAAEKPEAQVRAELVREMVPEGEAEAGAPEKAAAGSEGKKQELQATFGYPAGVSKDSCFARFDIRDEVCRRFGGFKHGQVVFYREAPEKEFAVVGVKLDRRSGQERLWLHPQDLSRPGSVAVQPEDLECLMPVYKGLTASIRKRVTLSPVQASGFEALEDSDGEGVLLCSQCRLPVGTTLYSDQDGNPMHAECMAQRVQRDLRGKEEQLQKKEASEKKACRDTYCIGWSAKQIPLNVGPAQKLSLASAPRGMCCLMLEEGVEGPNVRVLPTMDPACSVNLEYLSLALKVRYTEGREPTFSLDPVVETGALPELSKKMQLKNFEPQWLKGTSVGEVLFQSDYHLKELSMGEQQQPVVGMRSCFDLSAGEAGGEWRAREWYVVRSAEMQLSEDNVLIPQLQMGVEAREQVLGADGLEDKPLTRPDHPLVRYAQEFTENFDLIAERRSVVHHLRELAKASLIAKFLLESKVELDEPWFDLAEETSSDCCMEIPQLWNERSLAQIRVREGRIVDSEKLRCPEHHGVYGGVKFGLDRFRLGGTVTSKPGLRSSPAAAVRAAMPTLSMSDVRSMGMLVASMQGKGVAPPSGEEAVVEAVPGAVAGARPSMAMVPGMAMRGAAPMGPAPVRPAPSAGALARQMQGMLVSKPGLDGRRARLDVPSLHGVDLNLDQFNLDEPVRVASLVAASGWGEDAVMSKAFWSELENDSSSIFSVNDKALFREVFNPSLSDRREEGEQFAPPDPSFEYIERLRCLVEQEREVRRQRKEHFLSSKFMANNPGPLFPSAWLDSFEISREAGLAALPQGSQLQPRPDYQAQAAMFEHALKEASPVFDRSTEDGLCFRVYKFGSLEVRTTQERDGSEVIGAVFSIKRATDATGARQRVQENEKVTKVAEYVESYKDAADEVSRRSYVVLETEEGNVIVTEKRADGTISWEENPDDLEDRNSLAKFIRSCGCSPTKKALVTVKDMETFKKEKGTSFGTSTSGCKHYAQAAFNHARGCIGRIDSGFGSKGSWHKDKAAKDVKKETRKETRRSDMLARRAAAKQAAAVKSARSSTGRKVIDPIIVGTWDDWKYGEPMVFDEQSSSYIVELEVGPEGRESFQVLCDGDWDLCLHPDEDDASPRNALCGPDSDGHGKNWTIGSTEEAPEGSVFRVVLRVSASGCAEKVEWERMA